MSARAISYAEDTLRVHEIWDSVVKLIDDFDEASAELDKALAKRRDLQFELENVELSVIADHRVSHSELSETAFRNNLKLWLDGESEYRLLRLKIKDLGHEISTLEFMLERLKFRIKANSSRMEELGGYLNYLAAVKNRAEQNTQREEKT